LVILFADYIEILTKKQSRINVTNIKNHLFRVVSPAIVEIIMNKDTTISPIEALKWYEAMDVDYVLSTDPNRWDVKNVVVSTPRHCEESEAERGNRINIRGADLKGDCRATQISLAMTPQHDTLSPRILADKATNLEQLKEALLSFHGCDLKKTAINTVFGDGVATAKIMLIGEAPGASEDATGIPFCGESGKLLDNMISAIGLTRSKNVYITNTIFWRPPANRRPTNEEIEICRPFVEKHIALIQPDLLILVGATAVTSLLGELQISKIRQEYYQYQNQYLANPITTTALFHPAYLMRQPFQKKTTWYDLLKIQEFLARG